MPFGVFCQPSSEASYTWKWIKLVHPIDNLIEHSIVHPIVYPIVHPIVHSIVHPLQSKHISTYVELTSTVSLTKPLKMK